MEVPLDYAPSTNIFFFANFQHYLSPHYISLCSILPTFHYTLPQHTSFHHTTSPHFISLHQPLQGNVYWMDKHRLLVSTFNGTLPITIVSTTNNIIDFAIDSVNGLVVCCYCCVFVVVVLLCRCCFTLFVSSSFSCVTDL